MRCPECKSNCPAKAVSCDRCGAALAQPLHAPSTVGTLAGVVCVGVVLFKLFVPAGATRNADRWPSPPHETARGAGPTLNGVPYDNSPYVHKVNLNQPAAPPSPR